MTRAIKTQTKRFMITKINPDLWRKFKAACASCDVPIREVFIDFMLNTVTDYDTGATYKSSPILKWRKEHQKK